MCLVCRRAVGCIFGEFLLKAPLLPGRTELEQLQKISELIGCPDALDWPGFSSLPLAETLHEKLPGLPKDQKLTTMFPYLSPNVGACACPVQKFHCSH